MRGADSGLACRGWASATPWAPSQQACCFQRPTSVRRYAAAGARPSSGCQPRCYAAPSSSLNVVLLIAHSAHNSFPTSPLTGYGSEQVEADIRPFRGMLLGLFFVSTGASLDVKLLLHETPIIIALLGGLLSVKVGIIGSLAPFFGLNKCAPAVHLGF